MPFRSKTEAQVAETLDMFEVSYQYEPGTIAYTLQYK